MEKETTEVMEVQGDYALCTSPAMKVERFSYPILTPSAVRGIFDSVFFKRTKFVWRPTRIEILSHPDYPSLPYPTYVAIRGNEVKSKVPLFGRRSPCIDVEEDRTQRMSMLLKAPAYRLYAKLCPWPEYEKELPALQEQFQHRVERGQCFKQPWFGLRECVCYFRPRTKAPVREDIRLDIGMLLYDVFDLSKIGPKGGGEGETVAVSYFHAKIVNGVLDIPPYQDPAVKRGHSFTRWAA